MKVSNWDREILRLAVPSIVTNVTVPLLGLVDLAIVGHIGNETMIVSPDGWYDLRGNRIPQPQKKGLYINNGRKVVVR
jgi:hypothetical protein